LGWAGGLRTTRDAARAREHVVGRISSPAPAVSFLIAAATLRHRGDGRSRLTPGRSTTPGEYDPDLVTVRLEPDPVFLSDFEIGDPLAGD
jgi:hypothetical protein